MDSEAYAIHEEDDVRTVRPAASGLNTISRVISAPEPRRPDGEFLTSKDQAQRKRESPMDRGYQRGAGELSSPTSRSQWADVGGPRTMYPEPPDKRVRLGSVPEKSEADEERAQAKFEPDMRGSSARFSGPPLDTHVRTGTQDGGRYRHTPGRRPSLPPILAGSQQSYAPRRCDTCADTQPIIFDVVRELVELQNDIHQSMGVHPDRRPPVDPFGSEMTKLGLRESLEWALSEIRSVTRLVRENMPPKAGLPPLADVMPSPFVNNIRRLSLHGQSPTGPHFLQDPRRPPTGPESSARSDEYQRRGPEPPFEQMNRSQEHTLPSLAPPDDRKRNQIYEQPMSGVSQSPHPSSASSVFGSLHSPAQSQPSSRTLPSPPGGQSAHPGSSVPFPYPPNAISAAHASHLQDLQHQISTKTLAMQTLQREHDQLLAAFSRSQIRCTALDKKSKVSDHEINTLTMDKVRLGQQVERLEAQVSELVKARDEVNQKSSADGAQWRQIMAMSSQLQAKGAEEARQFKEEREMWERESASLKERIAQLESGKDISPAKEEAASSATIPVANDPVLTSESIEVLRAEVVRLRRRCVELELRLQELAGETDKLDQAISAMEAVRQLLPRKQKVSEDG